MPNLNVDSESRLTTEKAENVFCLLSTPHWNHLDNCQQLSLVRGFPGWCSGKQSPCQWKETQEMWVQSLGREDPLEEEMATHSFSCLGNPMDRGA